MSEYNTTRPALEGLIDEQKEVIEAGLDGFESNRQLTIWCHDLAVLSFGFIEDRVLQHTPSSSQDRVLTEAFTGTYGEPDVAEKLRQRFVAYYVIEPFGEAVEALRWSFTEYDNAPDAAGQENVAMRPAMEELRQAQREQIRSFMAGFDSKREFINWGEDLHRGTLGYHGDEFVKRCMYEPGTWDIVFGGDVDLSRNQQLLARQRMVSHFLFPWYAEALREQAPRASEQASDVEPDLDEYELGEGLFGEDTRDGGR